MITQTGRYALRAVLFLAGTEGGGSVTASEVARGTRMPRNYLTKILNTLVQAGILESARGPHGGFRLVRSPGDLSLADVLAPFEPIHRGGCILGLDPCPREGNCPPRRQCLALSNQLAWFFRTTSVADLVRREGPAHRGTGSLTTANRS